MINHSRCSEPGYVAENGNLSVVFSNCFLVDCCPGNVLEIEMFFQTVGLSENVDSTH